MRWSDIDRGYQYEFRCFCPQKLSRIMLVTYIYFWIIPLCLGTLITMVDSEQTLFMWTKSNPMFQAEGGARISVPVNSNLVINCPIYSYPEEYYRIYWVSEAAFKTCALLEESRFVIDCVPPYTTSEYVQEIKLFTGVPGGKDFNVSESYFLATFSNGTPNGLLNEVGGACRDYRLKLNVTITIGSTPSSPKPSKTPVPTTPGTATTRSTTPKQSPTTTSTTTTTTTHSTTSVQITDGPYPTDIPGITDIPIITVPDQPGGNTGVIDISSAQTLRVSSALLLSLCLSLLHILNLIPYIQR